ncbi:MAG: hypothetical protein AB9869_05075 [Verrucomicrobiia bacterium]
MSSTAIAAVAIAAIFGGTLVGLAVRRYVPEHHLNAESRDAVKAGAGMITMMSALVLGLLVSSAKSNFDSANDAIVDASAKIILLDRVLVAYGPELKELREHLRRGVATRFQLLWPEERLQYGLVAFEKSVLLERLLQEIRDLTPQSDVQRALQQQAVGLCNEMLLTRWLQIEQSQTALPTAFLVILLFWLTMLYFSFGLLAPRNLTVITAMFIGALSLATALFLILEMNRPMGGIIKVSSGPMRKALEHLGR